MKKVILSIVLLSALLIIQTTVASSVNVYHSERYISGGNGPWWDIGGWTGGYGSTSDVSTYWTDGLGNNHYKRKVICSGNGSHSCPQSIFSDPNSDLPTSFAQSSYDLMTAHIRSLAEDGTYSGSQDFNIVIGEQTYYRNATWTGSSTHVDIQMTITKP